MIVVMAMTKIEIEVYEVGNGISFTNCHSDWQIWEANKYPERINSSETWEP